jgi:hypothetical protein
MTFALQGIDRDVIEQVSIEFDPEPAPVAGFPGATTIPLQFPPRITDDTKTANWKEIDVKSYEPQAIWMGASARKITMQFQYIVAGGKFGVFEIQDIARTFKAYFYRNMENVKALPRVVVKFYNQVGIGQASFRLTDVNITHGDTLIKQGSEVWPLLTTIKVGAYLVTNIGGKGQQPKQKIPQLDTFPRQEWY